MTSSCSLDPLNKAAKGAAQKALKVALSVLLVVGLFPVMEQKAEASEGNVRIVDVVTGCSSDSGIETTYAIDGDGVLWAWGYNACGQIGSGTTEDQLTPAKIMTNMESVRHAGSTVYALSKSGSLWAWGSNEYGQIGDGTTVNKSTPVKVLESVADVCVDERCHTAYAVAENGSLWAWGRNENGEIGDGTKQNRVRPVKVLEGVASVSVSYEDAEFDAGHVVYALGEDGSLWAWGENTFGRVGDGTREDRSVPTQVLTGVKDVQGSHDGRAYALTEDGVLWKWGRNDGAGTESGSASTIASILTPVKLTDGVVSMHCANDTAYAISEDGSLWAWGANNYGQVGEGRFYEYCGDPVRIMDDVILVEHGWWTSYAITADGSLWAWGSNEHGQIGDGDRYNLATPFKVMDGIASVSTMNGTVYATTEDGLLWAWGSNYDGEVGDGTVSERVRTPVKVMEQVSSMHVEKYGATAYAIATDGSLYTWGGDGYQVSNGTGQTCLVPTRVMFPGDSPGGIDGESGELPSDPEEPDAPTSSETIETKALVRAEEDEDECAEYPIVWDDDWFKVQNSGSFEYNSGLSLASCALAASAYSNTSKNEHKFVKTTLKRLGFSSDSVDVSSYVGRVKNEGYGSDFDKVAYAFATKEIPDGQGGWDTLVAVVVRGTPGNVEWISNANVNDTPSSQGDRFSDSAHEGFFAASAELEENLDAYLAEKGVDKAEAKFLVTGHSRGAAVANIVAARLNDDKAVDMRNVYAYCFATPRVSASEVAKHHSSEYDNIINVVNPEDFVPRVPLARWGYERYGRTFYLPCKSTQNKLWKEGVNRVESDYYVHFNDFYQSFKSTGPTDRMVKNVLSLAPSFSGANTLKHSHVVGSDWTRISFMTYFKSLMKYLAYGEEELKSFLVNATGSFTPVTGYFFANHVLSDKVFGAHSEKTYLTWLRSLDEMGQMPIEAGQKCDTGKMTMYCPVDVTVYDPDGNVAARIVDDVLDEELAESDEGLAAYVDPETGAKSVWVPLGQGYRVETVATDSGTLDVTWSVSDPEGETLSQEARVDLPLEEGTTYTAEVSDQGSDGSFEDSVSFVDDDGEEIQPDFTADAESAGSLSVSVTATEGGTASGNAQATAGDHVTVSATPEPGYLFGGWYEGDELVSSEAEWTFRAEASRSLEARFVKCDHPNGAKPCNVCGCARFTLDDCDVTISPNPIVYAGQSTEPEVNVSFDGIELVEGEDYRLVFSGAGRPGRASAVISPIVGHISNRYGYWLEEDSVDMEFWYHFTISKAKLTAGMVTLPQASYVYSGKVQKPKPKVKVGNAVQYASDYEITYWNKAKTRKVSPKLVGTYWVRVKSRPTAKTTGTVWKKLVISPKATYVSGCTRLNNGFRVSWKKRTVQCSGYQVRYSLRSDFKTYGTKTLKGYGYSSKKVTGLKDKRTYYVKVRTYKTVNGVRYYSAWSPVKTVKTR